MLTLPTTFQQYWNPAQQFIRDAVTLRTALIGAGFLAAVSVALVAVNIGNAALSCSADEDLLVYPLYSNKGLAVDSVERCGVPHRGCMERASAKGTFDCSPFMAPKGTLSAVR